MNRKRLLAAGFYLLAILAMLWCVWVGLEKPLPWRWDFRRAERAMLLEPMEILRFYRKDGIVVAAGDSVIAVHGQKKDTTLRVHDNDFLLFPVEQGTGSALWGDIWGYVLYACGYETSDQSVWAELELSLMRNAKVISTLNQTAKKENGAFFFRLAEGSCSFTGERWPIDALSEVIWKIRNPMDEGTTDYSVTITFYDETGNVTAVHRN